MASHLLSQCMRKVSAATCKGLEVFQIFKYNKRFNTSSHLSNLPYGEQFNIITIDSVQLHLATQKGSSSIYTQLHLILNYLFFRLLFLTLKLNIQWQNKFKENISQKQLTLEPLIMI